MKAVIDEMNRRKPGKEKGEFHYQHPYSYEVEAHGKATQVKCQKCKDDCWHAEAKVKSVTITYEYWIEMPNWPQSGKASQDAQDAWNEFGRLLRAHEEGHRQILTDFWKKSETTKALADLMKALSYGEAHDAGRAADLASNALKAEIERVIEDLLDKHDEEQRAYDKTTKHGAKQSKVGGEDVVLPDKDIATW
jgi:predicted secreted Zn-dependent protease